MALRSDAFRGQISTSGRIGVVVLSNFMVSTQRFRCLVALVCAGLFASLLATVVVEAPAGAESQDLSVVPQLEVEVVADNLSIPWDLAVTPDGTVLFTERRGRLKVVRRDGTVQRVRANLNDLFVAGESGLLGLVLSPDFAETRRFYTCQAAVAPDRQIQVVGWTIDDDYQRATRFANPLVADIPLTFGRHGGCRLRFGSDAQLYIATGDSAVSEHPQSLTSLGGKVLRVDPLTGEGSVGNPFVSSANADTRRIYTYGHRNLQGLALRPGTDQMWSVEHGPSTDDEVNLLVPGGNYGWDPGPGYDEGVPMTDLEKFPDAVEAKWATGSTTLALSGGIFIDGRNWGTLDGTFAVAALKAQSLRFLRFDAQGNLEQLTVSPELNNTFGRLRTPMMGEDGAFYLTTANGSNDKILKITPTGAPVGEVSKIRRNKGKVRVTGWAIDPNRSQTAVKIRVTIDGELVVTKKARRIREDLVERFPGVAPRHGFSFKVDVPEGRHRICVEAVDIGPRKGDPVTMRCKRVTVPAS